ncbi:MAG: hypothetical protein ACKV2V_19200 [Blastocatellia bacterium]
MKFNARSLVLIQLFLLLGAICALAQTRPVPALTTEDAPRRSVAPTAQGQRDNAFDGAEAGWNARYREALARVKDLDRRADQAEMASVETRNAIYTSGPHTPQSLNQLNQRVNEQANLGNRLRVDAEQARARLDIMIDEAERTGYKVRRFALFRDNGEPDEDSFRERFLELQQDLRDARARARVYELRANRAGTNLRATGCNGPLRNPDGSCVGNDNFYMNRVRADLESAQRGRDAAQARAQALANELAELQRRGLAAGLEPGVFR